MIRPAARRSQGPNKALLQLVGPIGCVLPLRAVLPVLELMTPACGREYHHLQ